jgi:hypothetical protein
MMSGYFTQAHYVRFQPAAELERRLGYRSGRLGEGWWLCFMMEMPATEDFEVRGFTQMSGGITQGHLASPPDPRNSEQRLKDGGYDLGRIKACLVAATFTLSGPKRLCKVVPVRGEFGSEDYPPGSGIPQWTLLKSRPKRFKVAARVGQGEIYTGNYT